MSPETDRICLPAGTPLFFEGDPGDYAYLVLSGEIAISIRRGEDDIVLAKRGAGEIVGEMALIDGGARSASAHVTADCEIVAVSREQASQRLADSDPMLRMCLRTVINRYRESLPPMTRRAGVPDGMSATERTPTSDFQATIEALTLERQIEAGLRRNEFELYLQPIVTLADRRLAGFEALVRWNHPTRGTLPPSAFIPAAETSGVIVRLTEHMIASAVSAIAQITAAAERGTAVDDTFFVSVNVSGHDLVRPGFADLARDVLAGANVDPRHLKLEITESMLMKDPAGAARILDACRGHGMTIAVDDFGTGYSNLSYLGTLPISTLKIDRSFVASTGRDPASRKIVGTIRHLAHDLGLDVVAEGIETDADATLLRDMGSEYGQGYFFGRPAQLAPSLALARSWRPQHARRRSSPASPPADTASTPLVSA